MEATIVKRTSKDQLRAGPVIPLIDQAAVGASGGTFVIAISDKYDEDIAKFSERYSYLVGMEIENLTMKEEDVAGNE